MNQFTYFGKIQNHLSKIYLLYSVMVSRKFIVTAVKHVVVMLPQICMVRINNVEF